MEGKGPVEAAVEEEESAMRTQAAEDWLPVELMVEELLAAQKAQTGESNPKLRFPSNTHCSPPAHWKPLQRHPPLPRTQFEKQLVWKLLHSTKSLVGYSKSYGTLLKVSPRDVELA